LQLNDLTAPPLHLQSHALDLASNELDFRHSSALPRTAAVRALSIQIANNGKLQVVFLNTQVV
jgi:hypothetical protein